jgi:hypothetical protein
MRNLYACSHQKTLIYVKTSQAAEKVHTKAFKFDLTHGNHYNYTMSKSTKNPTSDPIIALKAAFNALWPISPEAWSAFEAIVTLRRLKSKDIFIREGDASTRAGYVITGLFRAIYTKADGVEYTQSFFPEGSLCAAYPAFLRGVTVPASFEALEDSEIIEFPLKPFRDLFTEYPEWCHIGRILTEQAYLVLVRRPKVEKAHIRGHFLPATRKSRILFHHFATPWSLVG